MDRPDNQELRDAYRELSDERIGQIACLEVRELRGDAVRILRAEIDRRGFPQDLHRAIDVQLRGLPPAEFQELLAWFRNGPCPRCGRRDRPLTAFRFGEPARLDSPLSRDPSLVAGCPRCLARILAKFHRSTTWGCVLSPLAWIGLGRTMRELNDLEEAETRLRSAEPGPELAEYVHDHVGMLYLLRLRDRRGAASQD